MNDKTPEACPRCDARPEVAYKLRPNGLPPWVCLRCGYYVAEQTGESVLSKLKKIERSENAENAARVKAMAGRLWSDESREIDVLTQIGNGAVWTLLDMIETLGQSEQLNARRVLERLGSPAAEMCIGPNPRKEWRERWGSMVKGLDNRKSFVRESWQRWLTSRGGPAVPIAARLLVMRSNVPPRARMAAAQALGDIGTQEAGMALAHSLHLRHGVQTNGLLPLSILIFCTFATFGIGLPIALGALIVTDSKKNHRLRDVVKLALKELDKMGNPQHVGRIAATAMDPRLNDDCVPILRRLLPRVTQEIAESFGRGDCYALEVLIESKDLVLCRNAIRIAGMVGGESALQRMWSLIRNRAPSELQSFTRDQMDRIQRRLDAAKDQKLLLRAAHADASERTLLLRARGTAEDHANSLLRVPQNWSVELSPLPLEELA